MVIKNQKTQNKNAKLMIFTHNVPKTVSIRIRVVIPCFQKCFYVSNPKFWSCSRFVPLGVYIFFFLGVPLLAKCVSVNLKTRYRASVPPHTPNNHFKWLF